MILRSGIKDFKPVEALSVLREENEFDGEDSVLFVLSGLRSLQMPLRWPLRV